ncbi:MAG: DNA repair protein RecN [Bacteroidales bacterium]|nr:DNA repair protein RecN [Bacteroidales bacterium]
MLQSLKIQNYALIDEIHIGFYPGFLTITGETGAGKSILIGALSLILGNRADTSVLKDESRKCVVEATFHITNSRVKEIFEKHDLDYEAETIIRREISSKGKSRAFVNDTPVNIKVLKELGDQLVDIHSQHHNLILKDNVFQLDVVDSYAGNGDLLSDYYSKYREYKDLQGQYNNLKSKSEQASADYDYYRFQFDQLEQVNLTEGEQEKLESELETLNHAEEIKFNLSSASYLLNNEESSVISQVREAGDCLRKIVDYYSKVKEISERLESTYIELQDLSNEIDMLNEDVEHDPNRIEYIRQRLDDIYSLQHKHRVSTEKELIDIRKELENKLEEINNYDFHLEELEKALESKRKDLSAAAGKLSESRKKSIPAIEKKITSMLKELGIPNASFKIKRTDLEAFNEYGLDHVQFLFSANKNVDLEDISKVASGGELSRLMLSLKSTIAENQALPTIIFDEIDSGTSGDIADKMGTIMKHMARNMQILNITHLPQIASKGDYHYLVYKYDDNESTHTYIKQLKGDERIKEIAKMLSGEELTDTAFQNAREFLENS